MNDAEKAPHHQGPTEGCRAEEIDSDLRQKLKWLLGFRLVITILCLCVILIRQKGFGPASQNFLCVYCLLILANALNVLYLLLLRRVRSLTLFAIIQVSIDFLCETAMVYLTGGVESNFTFLFYLSILSAAIFISARASIFLASLASVLLSSMSIVYFLSSDRLVNLPFLPLATILAFDTSPSFLLGYLVAHFTGLNLVAILSGWLARELKHVRILSEEILENMMQGVIVVNGLGKVAFVNRKAREMLSLDPKNPAKGKNVEELLGRPEHSPIALALTEPGEKTLRLDIRSPSGRVTPLEVATTTIPDERGRLRGTMAIMSDLSIHLKMEEAEKRAAKSEAIRHVSLGLAHEIRNPMTSIRGCAQEFRKSVPKDTEEARLLDIVLKESDRLNRIVTTFLEFGRAPSPRLSRCSPAKLMDDVITLLRLHPSAEAKSIDIRTSYPPTIEADADEEQLKQVFYNVLLNAMDASEKCGVIEIAMSARVPTRESREAAREAPPPGDGVVIEILDHGNGMSEDEVANAFTPFYTTKPGGTGMGLSIAARLVQAHDGVINIESQAAKGTKVSIFLPRRESGKIA